MKKLFICIFAQLVWATVLPAQDIIIADSAAANALPAENTGGKAAADSAYAAENYPLAAQLYAELLKEGEHPAIYYNLGNSYYKQGNIAKAILNYERALLLQPSDADIRFNLELARTKTVDKIVPQSEMFFVRWYHALVNSASVDGWAYTGVSAFILMLLLVTLYLLSGKIIFKKVGFFGALCMFVVTLLANIFAWQQHEKFSDRRAAIVMTTSVAVKSTPNASGTDLFILHEGTRVEVVDASMKEWKEIRIADGKVGWMPAKAIEMI